uniref:Uncharacterized protein n=1 Tax=Zea mays TaxID=4577 RepID=A0A804ND95_MAIZE
MNDGKVVCVVGFAFLFAVDSWIVFGGMVILLMEDLQGRNAYAEIEVAYNCRKGKYGVADEDIILYGQCV